MLERGVVVSNNENGVDVQMQPSASCEGCNVCFMDKSKLQTVHVNQKVSAQPGDFVEIEVSPGFAVKSAFLIFFLPLLMLLAGYFIFQSFHGIPVSNPLYRGILGGIGAMVATYIGVYYYDKHLQKSTAAKQVRIVQVLKSF